MRSRWVRVGATLAALVAVCGACGSTPAQPSAAGSQDAVAVRAAFIKGLNGFCRQWYDGQKRDDERFVTLAHAHQYDLPVAAETRHDDRLLASLRPLPEMAPTFARFVRNEKAVLRSRVMFVREDPTGQMTPAQEAFDRALEVRHSIARTFGASECDGVLPPSQRRAAVAALRQYVRNRSPHRACVTLVTPEFAESLFPSAHPTATCLEHFRAEYSGLYPQPTGIRVSQVTGVDGLSATVHYLMTPDCGCGELVARLYLEHGRWLLRNGYRDETTPAVATPA